MSAHSIYIPVLRRSAVKQRSNTQPTRRITQSLQPGLTMGRCFSLFLCMYIFFFLLQSPASARRTARLNWMMMSFPLAGQVLLTTIPTLFSLSLLLFFLPLLGHLTSRVPLLMPTPPGCISDETDRGLRSLIVPRRVRATTRQLIDCLQFQIWPLILS